MNLEYIIKRGKAAALHQHHAAKEVLQQCLLAALARQGLLSSVAFIGGTALRILCQVEPCHRPRIVIEDLVPQHCWTNQALQPGARLDNCPTRLPLPPRRGSLLREITIACG